MTPYDAELSRRHFVKTGTVAAGGLVAFFTVPSGLPRLLEAYGAAPPAAAPSPPNAFIRIAADDSITIVINKLEMGQGVNTSMAQLIAEELECDWAKIKSVSADVDPVYNSPMGIQMTGGSTAIATTWLQYRQIGANMREMLRATAAKRWGVKADECTAVNGTIVHKTKGSLRYGELADEAGQSTLPDKVKLKNRKDFKVIGHSPARVDAVAKSRGGAEFGMDVRIPGMVYAMVAHPPVAGAKITALDDKAARAVPGVVDVVRFGERVAVTAKNTFAARKGRDSLQITWDPAASELSTAALEAQFKKAAADGGGLVAEEKGGAVEAAMARAKSRLTADYLLPFLAHAPMEPLNVTISFDGQKCEMWSGHQMPGLDRLAAAKVLGIDPAAVKVNTTYAGGSFGRRASKNSDYVIVASELAKTLKKPVKLVWSREDDMRGGYYRPMAVHKVDIGLDGKKLLAWDHHVVSQSIMKGSPFEAFAMKGGIDATAVEGVTESAYERGAFRCKLTLPETPLTTLWWRSVGHTHTAFVMETMLDELAETTGQDPLALRRAMLKKSPRHLATLDLLAKISGWPARKPEKDRAFGVALHQSFGTIVGQVVEVSLDKKVPRIHRVWAAVNCGEVVNPEVAKSQVEGAIVFGLSAALYQQITVKNGKVNTGNFDDYPVMRMNEMPLVEVAFVQTDAAPTGLGEPGVPPAAPAVANALYKLTKTRIRTLPFARSIT